MMSQASLSQIKNPETLGILYESDGDVHRKHILKKCHYLICVFLSFNTLEL